MLSLVVFEHMQRIDAHLPLQKVLCFALYIKNTFSAHQWNYSGKAELFSICNPYSVQTAGILFRKRLDELPFKVYIKGARKIIRLGC